MLINLRDMLRYAAEKNVAVPSFNVYNVESVQAVWQAAQKKESPIIIAFGESYDSHMPIESAAALIQSYVRDARLPVVLHLDHCRSQRNILRALRAGFTSVMFDASAKPLADNIEETKAIVHMAHDLHVSVEGELGYMNEEDGTGNVIPGTGYTTVSAACQYAEESGVDALAIAIGNAHGIYKGTPSLDLDRLDDIRKAVAVPLVLHGSSGIPVPLLQEAIRRGIRKINVNTEVSTTGIQAARNFLASHMDPNTRFEKMTKSAETAMSQVVETYMDICALKK